MNWKPVQYHLGLLKDRGDIYCSLAMLSCLDSAVGQLPYVHTTFGAAQLSLSALGFTTCALLGKKYFFGKISLWKNQRMVNRNRELFPLEFVDKICIDDPAGLEGLMDRTAKDEKLEWGTVLRASEDKGKGVIEKILDSHTAEEEKYVVTREKKRVGFNALKVEVAGYTGDHHFHPGWYRGLSFHLNCFERASWPGGLHLLTFNLADGPEIIGFNTQFTYVPTDQTKRELTRVNYKQLMAYLRS